MHQLPGVTERAERSSDGRYTFNNDSPEAADQIRLLAKILDPHSIGVLDGLHIAPGWQCLDLGAGAGTISTWLAANVAPSGHVTAIDKKPQHIHAHQHLTVRIADAATVDLGQGVYDLIHARLLLMHLPERDLVLHRAAAALKPGGLLVISDWDTTHLDEMIVAAPSGVAEMFLAFQNALVGMAADNGMSTDWARRVPAVMRQAGLTGIETTVYNRLWTGGEAGCLLHASNSRQLEEGLRARGLTLPQLQTLRAAMSDPDVLAYSWPMFTSVGVRRS